MASAKNRTKKSPSPKTKRRSKKAPLSAKTADRHILYQRSVQEPSAELGFIDRVYKSLNGKKKAKSLREDFCGTALLCAAWAKDSSDRTATGIDIDKSVLAWGKQHNIDRLKEDAERVTLLQQDVRDRVAKKHDVVCALNFSYWVFRTREEMRSYFAKVRSGINKNGFFFLDAYGGWEAHEPMEEKSKKRGGFTYIWDQHEFDPITHEIENHIHFDFADGTRMERAFSYYWRFWTLPELQELLKEAGFSEVTVYWDVSQDVSRDDFRPKKRAKNQPGWLAYLVATV